MDNLEHQLHINSKKIVKEQRKLTINRFLNNNLAMTGFILLTVILIFTFVLPLFLNLDAYSTNATNRLMSPNSESLLGTDNYGRDLLSRLILGTQSSLFVGFAVALLASVGGVIIGLYSGFYKSLDLVLMRVVDGVMAFPAILLAITIMAVFGTTVENVILTLGIVYIPLIARIVRSSVLVIKEQTYIEALKAMGASHFRIIWFHIFPNAVSPLIVQATFVFAIAMITEAMLSFLGVGIPTPHPSLGNILYDGKNVIRTAWWMTVFPGVMIILLVLSLNLFGDGLRDILDPHTQKSKKKG